MRPLTPSEKEASQVARKIANERLVAQRSVIVGQLRQLPITAESKRDTLQRQLDALRDVRKGHPVRLQSGDDEIVLDHDLLRRLIRTFKRQRYEIAIRSGVLVISYGSAYTRGILELLALPQYQQDLLADLPCITV